MATRIGDLTVDDLGTVVTDADLAAFQAACHAYLAQHGGTEDAAIDAIWNDGDCWAKVHVYAPEEAARADSTRPE